MQISQIKEELHISYISIVCAAAGITYETQYHDDDSTDGIMKKELELEENVFNQSAIRIQLKCTSSPSQYEDRGEYIAYKLKVKNYNDLCTPSTVPIILGLLILPENMDDWVRWSEEELLLKGSMYWADFSDMERSENKGSVTVQIPKKNIVNGESILGILQKIAREEWPL